MIVKGPHRVEIPHEPGEWVDILPLTAGMAAKVQRETVGKLPADVSLAILALIVVAWSYDEPVSAESLGALDVETFDWLANRVNVGARTDAEKKDSANGSTPPPVSAGASL